jgi:hypothetical protein
MTAKGVVRWQTSAEQETKNMALQIVASRRRADVGGDAPEKSGYRSLATMKGYRLETG